MDKVKNILGLVTRVLVILLLVATTFLSLTMAYIMFAPDTFPKPFYLNYGYPNGGLVGTPVVVPNGTVVESHATPQANVEPTEVAVETKPGEGIMLDSGTKIINLTEVTGNKYIRVSITFEFAPADEKYAEMKAEEKTAYLTEFTNELTAKLPVIDDVVITLLSTKTFDTLYTAAGKEDLRQELMLQVNERLPQYHVIAVYFTEFVVN
jgi:flagellar basal body-associated protein FliL